MSGYIHVHVYWSSETGDPFHNHRYIYDVSVAKAYFQCPSEYNNTIVRAWSPRLIEQWYLGNARYEKGYCIEEKGRNISREAAPNVTVLFKKWINESEIFLIYM